MVSIYLIVKTHNFYSVNYTVIQCYSVVVCTAGVAVHC